MTATGAAPQIPRSASVFATARTRLSSTPGRLRAWSVTTALLAVVFGLAGSAAINARLQSIGDVRAAVDQLASIQTARVAAVEADSIATTSFLVGGLEDPVRRETYESRLADATERLTSVSGDSRTEQSLADASAALARYAGLVEIARSNNRQGYPVGAAYQREASTLMRDGIVVELDRIDRFIRDDVNGALSSSRRATIWLHLTGLAAVLTLLAASLWLARRTNRRMNPALVAATLAISAGWLVGGNAASTAASRAETATRGPITQFDALGQARAAAFDARSLEALTLIARGSGLAYQAQWVAQADLAQELLDTRCSTDSSACAAQTAFAAYRTIHTEIRRLDDGGAWDTAVPLAIAATPPESTAAVPVSSTETALVAFTRFDDVSAAAADAASAASVSDLDASIASAGWARWLVLAAGLGAAAAAVGGYTPRLREYR